MTKLYDRQKADVVILSIYAIYTVELVSESSTTYGVSLGMSFMSAMALAALVLGLRLRCGWCSGVKSLRVGCKMCNCHSKPYQCPTFIARVLVLELSIIVDSVSSPEELGQAHLEHSQPLVAVLIGILVRGGLRQSKW